MLDLLLDRPKLLLQRRALRARAGHLGVPQIAEHVQGEIEQPFGRAELAKQRLELALDHILADGFTSRHAAACVTEVVCVSRTAALRPTGGQRLTAMAAGHEPTERELVRQVAPRWGLRHAPEAAILHSLPGGEADQRLMLGRHQVEPPFLIGDMARIDGPRDHLVHPLKMNFIIRIARESRLRFQESFDLGHRFKPAHGETLKGLGDD